jgi:acetyltransferase-like isoleucine patch superfamily enzyme
MPFRARHLTPWGFAQGVRNGVLRWVARTLQPYLANAHLVWGDASRVHVGRGVVLTNALLNCRSGSITIEDDAFISHNCLVLTGKHDTHLTGQRRIETVIDEGRDIVIRRGAWIASGCIIIGPCEIGENAVIGAGSVVSGVVPAGALYAGNPARLVRKLALSDQPDS